nr:hypothetical protein [Ktedonobacteraceae bacterium]
MGTTTPPSRRSGTLHWPQRIMIVTVLLAMLFSGTSAFVEQAAQAAALAAYGPQKQSPFPGKPNR